jgi:hypothetical protein
MVLFGKTLKGGDDFIKSAGIFLSDNSIIRLGNVRVLVVTFGGWAILFFELILSMQMFGSAGDLAAQAQQASLQVTPSPVAARPAAPDEYREASLRMHERYPELDISVDPAGMSIRSVDVSQYQVWRDAVSSLSSLYPDWRWQIVEGCAGEACGKPPAAVAGAVVYAVK